MKTGTSDSVRSPLLLCAVISLGLKMVENLQTILDYWSYWDKEPPLSIERAVQLPQKLDPELLLAIQGVRRCGKSTLLAQLIKHYQLDKQRCLFVNFEDARFSSPDAKLLFQIVEYFTERFADEQPLYFFFDEIQEVAGWEKWLHTQLERPGRSYYVVTGSNASLLSSELSDRLTGRYRLIELFPFSFGEARLGSKTLSAESFIEKGGFPKPFLSGGDVALLQETFRGIAERDIARRIGARSNELVSNVLKMVFEAGGSELSLRRLGAAVGSSPETVANYLAAAEAAYLIGVCPFFAYSSRKQRVRNNKYYAVDSGLRRSVINISERDLGKDLELHAFWALKRKFGPVYYWRSSSVEVDFVVKLDGQRVLPVQVTWQEVKERHQDGVAEFYENFAHSEEALYLTHEDLEEDFAVLDEY